MLASAPLRAGAQLLHPRLPRLLLAIALGVLSLASALALSAQVRFKDTEWPTHSADLAGSRYRPLDQINASNFNKLEIAWRFQTGNYGPKGIPPCYCMNQP